MAKKPPIDLGLTGFEELFMTDEERQINRLPRIHDIPLELIDDFPDHPYKVRMDEDMMILIESIKENGVITPITLRQKEGDRYEIVSGHRRKRACELAGSPSMLIPETQKNMSAKHWSTTSVFWNDNEETVTVDKWHRCFSLTLSLLNLLLAN